MNGFTIRRETEKDYAAVEAVTREAFWNVYKPGCDEHYLVHRMRSHADFLPELAFVLEKDGEIIGNVMYAKCRLADGDGRELPIVSMGPLCVLPKYQRQGGSRLLLEHTFALSGARGYAAVVNFGNPGNYVSRGYVSCRRKRIGMGEFGAYPTALLVKELPIGVPQDRDWLYLPSDVDACCADTAAVEAFDARFPKKEKAWQPSQEEFYIYSHSRVVF